MAKYTYLPIKGLILRESCWYYSYLQNDQGTIQINKQER